MGELVSPQPQPPLALLFQPEFITRAPFPHKHQSPFLKEEIAARISMGNDESELMLPQLQEYGRDLNLGIILVGDGRTHIVERIIQQRPLAIVLLVRVKHSKNLCFRIVKLVRHILCLLCRKTEKTCYSSSRSEQRLGFGRPDSSRNTAYTID